MNISLKQKLSRSVWSVCFSSLLLVYAQSALAGTDTWTGGGTTSNWSDPNNWGGTAPLAGDLLFFDGTTQLSPNNDFAAGTIFNNIAFNAGAGSFTLGGNSIILTNPADGGAGAMVGGSITNTSPNLETVNIAITLAPGRHNVEADGGGQLNLSGAMTRSTGAVIVFNPVGGNINLTGSGLANVNGILGGWGFFGNDWASLDGSGNLVAYTGYTPITSGAIVSSPSSNVRYIGETANITATNAAINSLLNQQSAARTLTVTGVLRLGANGGIYRDSSASAGFTVTGGNLTTAGSGGELTLADGPFTATANNLTVASVITNDTGNAPVSLNVFGYVAINGANTHSGGTVISQGRVQTGNASAYGTGKVTVFPGGEAFINTAGTFVNSFDITGVGTTETSGGGNAPGAIRMGVGATAIITNKVTFHGNTRISTSNAGGPQIKGPITGDGQLEIVTFATDASVLQLGNTNQATPNSWPGGTLITAQVAARKTTLKLAANEQIPDGPGKGDLILNATGDWARLDLNGFSETVNGLISSNGTSANLQITNSSTTNATLIVGNNNASSTFAGVILDGPNVLNLSKIGTGTLTLTGANNFKGTNTVAGGSLIYDAGTFPPATPPLVINGNGTLDLSAVSGLGLGANASVSMANGTIIMAALTAIPTLTTTVVTAGGTTNLIGVSDIGAISAYPAQFPIIKAGTVNGTLNFGLSGSLPPTSGTPFVGFISNNVANNSVDLVLTSGPLSMSWVGFSSGAPNSAWDTSTPNWKLNGGAATTYADGSFVRFDDTASNGVVTLSQTVSPGAITVTNNSLSYTINDLGGAAINGSGGIVKQGSGTLVLDNSGVNGFTGGLVISGGTLQVGNNDANGSIPAGSLIDNGTLAFARNDTVNVPNAISGKGGVTINGASTQVVTLASPNTFTGAVLVASGTLQVGDNASLGTTNGPTTIANGATLDVNGTTGNTRRLTNEIFFAAGPGVGNNGAIINSGSDTFPTICQLTLTGNTTFGGTGRWDLRAPAGTTGDPASARLNTGGQPYNLTKVGTGFFGLVAVTVDPFLADIDVQGGTFDFEGNTTSLGDPAHTMTIESGAVLFFFQPTNHLNKKLVFMSQSTLSNNNGSPIIVGPITVAGDTTFGIGGTSLTLNGTLGGTGSVAQSGASPLTLNGDGSGLTNGYTLNGGTLNLNGLLGGPFTNVANANLAGTGTNLGITDISGNVFPGASNVVGTLTVSNLDLEPGGSVTFDLNFTATPGGGINDLLVVNGDLVFNGNQLNVNPAGLLQVGVPYVLFTYTGNLVNNSAPFIPSVNGYNFTLDTSVAGQVRVTASGGPPVWTGGSATDSNWSDAANWGGTAILPGTLLYFAGNTRVNNNNDTTAGNTYGPITFVSGAGAFTLSGNPITLGGGIINDSANPQTVNLGVTFSTPFTLNGESNTLIIGGGLTNTAVGTTNSIVLSGTGILTNLFGNSDPAGTNTLLMTDPKANWVLVDNATSTPMTNAWPINIQAGSLTIGLPGNAPVWTTTSVNGAPQDDQVGIISNTVATLTVSNGTFTTGARLNTATVLNSTGIVNQVSGTFNIQQQFQGANGANAGEQSILGISGGTMNINGGTGQIYVASRGGGIFNVNGGTVVCATLDVSRNANGNAIGSIGVVNLNSGVLSVGRIGTATANSQAGPPSSGTQPTAAFNFNGGTLLANTNVGANPFFQGSLAGPAIPITATVKAGGAIIDDGGNAISILEPLRHDSTLGSTLDGGLQKNGAGTLTLGAANTYTGPTVVNNGTLAVNGSVAATAVTVGPNGTLAGTGSFGSNVTVNGTISPNGTNALGTLTIASNLVLSGTATALIEVNKASLTNDLIKANSITYGGTLAVTNLNGTLAAGDAFKLFSANTYGGSFTSFALASPGSGLAWDTSGLTSGVIRVIATVNPSPTNITFIASGGNLTLSWPADHIGWHLQVQTNTLQVGVSTNWVEVPGASSTNQIVFPIVSTNPTVFYRLFLPH